MAWRLVVPSSFRQEILQTDIPLKDISVLGVELLISQLQVLRNPENTLKVPNFVRGPQAL